jgi:hypothetical protein
VRARSGSSAPAPLAPAPLSGPVAGGPVGLRQCHALSPARRIRRRDLPTEWPVEWPVARARPFCGSRQCTGRFCGASMTGWTSVARLARGGAMVARGGQPDPAAARRATRFGDSEVRYLRRDAGGAGYRWSIGTTTAMSEARAGAPPRAAQAPSARAQRNGCTPDRVCAICADGRLVAGSAASRRGVSERDAVRPTARDRERGLRGASIRGGQMGAPGYPAPSGVRKASRDSGGTVSNGVERRRDCHR